MRLLGAVVLVAWLLHGGHLQAEQVIWRFAEGRLDFVPACRAGAPDRVATAEINPSAGDQPANRASRAGEPTQTSAQDRP
jgi:hypothetical protein